MSQKSRPVADVSVGDWSPTPIYNRINEPTPDDETSVASPGSPQGDAFEVKLDPVGLPITGEHRLRVRMRRAGPDATAVRVELLQGAAVVASRVFTPGGAFQDYELLLTAAEIDRITDYADLRLRVAAFTAYSSSSVSASGSGSGPDSGSGSGSAGSGSRSGGSGSGSSGSGSPPVEVQCCPDVITWFPRRLHVMVTGVLGLGTVQCVTDALLGSYPFDYIGLQPRNNTSTLNPPLMHTWIYYGPTAGGLQKNIGLWIQLVCNPNAFPFGGDCSTLSNPHCTPTELSMVLTAGFPPGSAIGTVYSCLGNFQVDSGNPTLNCFCCTDSPIYMYYDPLLCPPGPNWTPAFYVDAIIDSFGNWFCCTRVDNQHPIPPFSSPGISLAYVVTE